MDVEQPITYSLGPSARFLTLDERSTPGVLRAVKRRIRNKGSCVRSRQLTKFPFGYWEYPKR